MKERSGIVTCYHQYIINIPEHITIATVNYLTKPTGPVAMAMGVGRSKVVNHGRLVRRKWRRDFNIFMEHE